MDLFIEVSEAHGIIRIDNGLTVTAQHETIKNLWTTTGKIEIDCAQLLIQYVIQSKECVPANGWFIQRVNRKVRLESQYHS